jgi:hypothetical protein
MIGGVRKKVGSFLPIMLLALVAWLAIKIGNTFGQALTIFAVMVWAGVGLLAVYLLLFKGVSFQFGADEAPVAPGEAGYVREEDPAVVEAAPVRTAEDAESVDGSGS